MSVRSKAAMALMMRGSADRAAEDGRELLPIGRVRRQRCDHRALAAGQPDFHRMAIQQRQPHLRFQRRDFRVLPAVRQVVGDIDQRHGTVGQARAGGAHRACPAVGETARRIMAAGAAVVAGHRQPRFKEQSPAQATFAADIGLSAGTKGVGKPRGSCQSKRRAARCAAAQQLPAAANSNCQRQLAAAPCAGQRRGLGRDLAALLHPLLQIRHFTGIDTVRALLAA